LPVLPKGSFFSILSVCTVVAYDPSTRLEKMEEDFRQRLTKWRLHGYPGSRR
jgi:hypothetical protein